MAVGDAARDANYALVPETGEEGRVRWGAREINRTRDYIAQLRNEIPSSKGSYRTQIGIGYGYNLPSTAAEGDLFFKIVG